MENTFTTRLYLVPLKQDIIKAAIIGDAQLASVLEITVLPDWTQEEFRQNLPIIAEMMLKIPLQNEWGWGSLIIHKAKNTLIGYIMVKIIPDAALNPTDAIELGYYIAPSYRQQGYASEAAKATIDWVLRQPTMQTVTAGCDPDNIGSKRVLEKIGMQLIDSRPNVLVWKLSKTTVV